MTTIQKDGYLFEVDLEKTIDYYKTHSLCDCDCCENYYAQIKGKFPKLESFLSDFGVDISKPDEAMSVELDNTIQYIGIDYTVCGKVLTMGQYKIDIQDDLLFSLVITEGFASPNGQTGDYFTISVNNVFELPWVLDKPFPEEKTFKNILRLFKRKNSIAKNPTECLNNIKNKISEKTGISKFIDINETSAAFSGSKDYFDLYVSVSVEKKRGKEYLSVYMDDHFEWKEWDFKSQDDFENAIVEYLCKRINRTIKTVTEMKRHKYIRVTEYTLNKETNEWILTSDEKVSNLIMRLAITEDSFTEIIKEYHL